LYSQPTTSSSSRFWQHPTLAGQPRGRGRSPRGASGTFTSQNRTASAVFNRHSSSGVSCPKRPPNIHNVSRGSPHRRGNSHNRPSTSRSTTITQRSHFYQESFYATRTPLSKYAEASFRHQSQPRLSSPCQGFLQEGVKVVKSYSPK